MAKVRKPNQRAKWPESKKTLKPWLENKILAIRRTAKPLAARAIGRYGAPAGVTLFLLITIYSFFLPKDQFQLAKERILKNPNDLEAHLVLAEEFLKNNQLNETERELLTAQKLQKSNNVAMQQSKVLGFSSKLETLWSRWQEENPQELKKLIAKWEKFVEENPTYRDGYLRLALYYFKLGENDKVEANLNQALKLDPNFEPTLKLQQILR